MDVTCDRCKAEYEFDDSLLGEKGTTVKCSSCQHVFRVAPPRKDARPMMKLRFRANGIVAPIASLRELQQRIQAGQIGPDDELGRDGAPWRKLQDVPELRGFFAAIAEEQPTATRARPAGLAVSQNSMPIPPHSVQPAKRTMVGVGPSQGPGIPRAPRMPAVPVGFEPKPPSAATPLHTPEVLQPVPTDALATTHSGAPPAPSLPAPPPAISPFPPVSTGRLAAPALASAHSSNRPIAAGVSRPESGSGASSLPPPHARTSLTSSASHAAESPPSEPAGGRGLFLADDEAPPARATEGSKSWIYIGAAGLLAIGGWFGVNALSNKSAPEATPAPRIEAPVAAAAPSTEAAGGDPNAVPSPTAGALAGPSTGAVAAAPGEPAAQAERQKPTAEPGGATNQPDKAAEPSPSATAPVAPAAEPERAESANKPARTGGSASEPTDYSGWVARASKLFKQNKLDEARAAYTKAIELRASGSEASAGLGAVLVASGDAQAALEPLERAARAGYADANVTLGDAYRKLGRKEDALEAYNTYVSRLPNGSRAAYAKLQASALGGDAKEEPSEEPAGAPVEYKPAGEPPTPAEPAP